MFQQKIDEIFNDMPNEFGTADDILVAGYDTDGKHHDDMVQRVLERFREVNLKKLNKEKCHFRCTSIPFFGKVISQNGVQLDPQKISTLMEMPPPNTKKELQAFLGIINYLILSKHSSSMLTSLQADIKQSGMDMECIIPGNLQQSQIAHNG